MVLASKKQIVLTRIRDEVLYSFMVPFWYYWWMPPKIRILIKELRAAGFDLLRTKGSHEKYVHPQGPYVWLSGKGSSDAQHYQVKEVRDVIAEVRNEKK